MSDIEKEPTRRLDRESDRVPDPSTIPEVLLGWDRYVLKRRLGSGGMGEVFRAWDPRLGRNVALKFLNSVDPETLQRFEREARAQARVDHPAICKVFEVGDVAGRRYIAMQEIQGVTLDRIAGSMSLEQKLSLIREVAEAIHSAHRQGLIHRDLKPGNILVEHGEDGAYRPFIVDFGLARDQQQSPGTTISGGIFGTPGYMSPEQARGRFEEIDRRTDVYNLGTVLYELVCGRPPFESETIMAFLVRLQYQDPPSPRRFNRSIPRDVETIILKALERDPVRRYDSAHAMAEDLRRFLDGEPIVARRTSFLYRLQTRVRKHRVAAVAIAAGLLLLAMAGASALMERRRADARAELAQNFGMEIKEIELLTRVARMLPPDRAVPLRTLVLPRMERIRAQMRNRGRAAEGPGSYALARASMALGDHRAAWDQLERARRAGYDTSDLHYARGLTLGHFYEEALARAEGIAEAEIRKAARDDAERRYRMAAIEELRLASQSTIGVPDLLHAQLALHEGRLDDAVAAARRATRSSPWLHEAIMVEVAALGSRGRALTDSGKFDEALAAYAEAGARLQSAIAIARGDATVYLEDCVLRDQVLRAIRFQRRLTVADAAAASAPCMVASRLDPLMASPWRTRGAIHIAIGEDQSRHGEDPNAQIVEAIAANRRAIVLDPRDAAAISGLGRAELTRARWGIPRGIDPRPLLGSAEQSLGRAVRAEPRSTTFRLSLANVYVTRGEYEQRIGGDPRPWLLKAIEQGQRALEPDPNLFLIHNLIGNTYNSLADREAARGGDPRGAIAEAAKAFDHAIALNPSSSPVHNNRGNTWLTLAEYLSGRGEPIDDPTAKAIQAYRRAIALRGDYTLAWINIGTTNRTLALDRVRHGRDPAGALSDAREALDRYEAANPGDIDAQVERARVAIVEARWLLRRGGDPRRAIAAAQRASQRALSVDKAAVAPLLTIAEAQRWEAEWMSKRNQQPAAPLRGGFETVARVRAADPQNAEANALEAALLMIDARTRDPESAAELRKRADALLKRALDARPSLRPDYAAR